MIVDLNKTIAYRCASCGEITFVEVSLTELCSNNGIAVHCSCGQSCLEIKTQNRNAFTLEQKCIFCDETHKFAFTFKDIAYKSCKEFSCPHFGFKIGTAFIGRPSDVAERIEDNEMFIRELAGELAIDHAGRNALFLLKAIDKIRTIAGRGDICCECGSAFIDVDVSANALFLICEKCGSVLPLTLDNIKSESFSRIERLVIPGKHNHAQ